jgi:hypothetical protein
VKYVQLLKNIHNLAVRYAKYTAKLFMILILYPALRKANNVTGHAIAYEDTRTKTKDEQ